RLATALRLATRVRRSATALGRVSIDVLNSLQSASKRRWARMLRPLRHASPGTSPVKTARPRTVPAHLAGECYRDLDGSRVAASADRCQATQTSPRNLRVLLASNSQLPDKPAGPLVRPAARHQPLTRFIRSTGQHRTAPPRKRAEDARLSAGVTPHHPGAAG